MPINTEAARYSPRQPDTHDPNHEYVNEWALPDGDRRPSDRNADTDNTDLSANNQLGVE